MALPTTADGGSSGTPAPPPHHGLWQHLRYPGAPSHHGPRRHLRDRGDPSPPRPAAATPAPPPHHGSWRRPSLARSAEACPPPPAVVVAAPLPPATALPHQRRRRQPLPPRGPFRRRRPCSLPDVVAAASTLPAATVTRPGAPRPAHSARRVCAGLPCPAHDRPQRTTGKELHPLLNGADFLAIWTVLISTTFRPRRATKQHRGAPLLGDLHPQWWSTAPIGAWASRSTAWR